MIHVIKYIKHEMIAKETAVFYFQKPSGFMFKAGQFGDLTIINPPETDAKGNTRTFSLLSSPSENDLAIATRLRDTAFKRNLKKLMPGDDLILEAPLGVFTLPANAERTIVLIAGGIGVTPMRSIVFDATEKKLPHKILLFLSNKSPKDSPYLNELQALQNSNPNFKLIATMTQLDSSDTDSNWHGEIGRLNSTLIEKYLVDANRPIFYLCGPEGMVRSTQKTLNDRGVKNEDIKIEEFTGY